MKILRPPTLFLLLLAACVPPTGELPRLSPHEQRPVAAVTVADGNEAALLVQELAVEPVRVDGARLYFIHHPALNRRLRELGYAPVTAEIRQVERRTVRVRRRGEERDLAATGVRVLTREPDHWIVTGTLEQVARLRDRGYQLSTLRPGEPRPREVLIRVPAGVGPSELARFQLDIYSFRETRAGTEVTAGAFDDQIDALRAAGFEVERISTVP